MSTSTVNTKADFKIGQEVIIDNGRRRIAGTIVALNRVNAVVQTPQGKKWNAPYAIVFKAGEKPAPAVSAVVVDAVYAMPGQVGVAANGQAYFITKANKTRYTAVRLSDNTPVYVPFTMVKEVKEGREFLMELMKERGVPLKARAGLVDLIVAASF